MPTKIDIQELPARLKEVLALAASGQEIILTEGAIPKARLVPCDAPRPRVPGLHPKAMQPAPDFEEPLPDDFWAAHP